MSIACMNWVWVHSEAGGTERLVLLALADEADDHGGSCYPSIRRLSIKTRMHTSTVIDAIKRLEDGGHLIVQRPTKRGRGRFNRYRIVMPGVIHSPDGNGRYTDVYDSEMRGSGSEMRGKRSAQTRANPTDPCTSYIPPDECRFCDGHGWADRGDGVFVECLCVKAGR